MLRGHAQIAYRRDLQAWVSWCEHKGVHPHSCRTLSRRCLGTPPDDRAPARHRPANLSRHHRAAPVGPPRASTTTAFTTPRS